MAWLRDTAEEDTWCIPGLVRGEDFCGRFEAGHREDEIRDRIGVRNARRSYEQSCSEHNSAYKLRQATNHLTPPTQSRCYVNRTLHDIPLQSRLFAWPLLASSADPARPLLT